MLDPNPVREPPESGPVAAAPPPPGLRHACDAEAGIGRRRRGRGFSYHDANGAPIGDPAVLARIRSLAIPPAWTDVWICPDPRGHIQATGRDERGRKQYRYHDGWHEHRDALKFARLADFAEALAILRRRIDEDMARRGLPREKVLALLAWLLDNTLIRVGNASYARGNGSFGLTTLRRQHVEPGPTRVRFEFVGKSGKPWRLSLTDRRIARIVRSVHELPGQHLFQYIDEDGTRRPLYSEDVNDYLRAAIGDDFSSKDFRTWGATARATMLFAATPLPETKTAVARKANELVDAVSACLGNTRAVCRSSYIHPDVESEWCAGRLCEDIGAIARRVRRARAGLDRDEAIVLAWLRRAG